MQHYKSEININRSFKGKHTSSAQWKHQQQLLSTSFLNLSEDVKGAMKWNQIWFEWYLKSIEIIRKKDKLGYILSILTLWKKITYYVVWLAIW